MRELIHFLEQQQFHLFSIKIPSFVLKAVVDVDMVKKVILLDQRIYPKHLTDAGFVFNYRDLQSILI